MSFKDEMEFLLDIIYRKGKTRHLSKEGRKGQSTKPTDNDKDLKEREKWRKDFFYGVEKRDYHEGNFKYYTHLDSKDLKRHTSRSRRRCEKVYLRNILRHDELDLLIKNLNPFGNIGHSSWWD